MQLLHVKDLCDLIGEKEGKSLFRFAGQYGCPGAKSKIGFLSVNAYSVSGLIDLIEETTKKPAVTTRFKSVWREDHEAILQKLKAKQEQQG